MFKKKYWVGTLFLSFIFMFTSFAYVFASPETQQKKYMPVEYVSGVVLEVYPMDNPNEALQKSRKTGTTDLVTLRLTSGPESGTEVKSLHHKLNLSRMFDIQPEPGDKVIVAISKSLGKTSYNIADYERLP